MEIVVEDSWRTSKEFHGLLSINTQVALTNSKAQLWSTLTDGLKNRINSYKNMYVLC